MTPNSEQAPSAFGEEETEQSSEDPPTVVVYVVNPFSSNSREESFPSYLGLLRCIAEIIPDISENGKKNIIFQVHQLPCLSVFPSIYLSTYQHGCLLVYLSVCIATGVVVVEELNPGQPITSLVRGNVEKLSQ